jgi:hypothetical protein
MLRECEEALKEDDDYADLSPEKLRKIALWYVRDFLGETNQDEELEKKVSDAIEQKGPNGAITARFQLVYPQAEHKLAADYVGVDGRNVPLQEREKAGKVPFKTKYHDEKNQVSVLAFACSSPSDNANSKDDSKLFLYSWIVPNP